jgi:hypothetical protein
MREEGGKEGRAIPRKDDVQSVGFFEDFTSTVPVITYNCKRRMFFVNSAAGEKAEVSERLS